MDCIICIIRQLEAKKESKRLAPETEKEVVAISNEYKNVVSDFNIIR